MSEDLLRKLRDLEEDFFDMPPVVQKSDLEEINRIRSELGMPVVDNRLQEHQSEQFESSAEVPVKLESESSNQPAAQKDHSEARAIYEAWQKKSEELKVLRDYASEVAAATAGGGMTPVRPLATMGSNGPLLCDHCGKPMVLEGGDYHRMDADKAWRNNPDDGWSSFIYGGMVVEIQTNGTLRIYHGYPNSRTGDCCNIAGRQDEQARAEFDTGIRRKNVPILREFIADEFGDLTEDEQTDLLNDILGIMFSYDPGPGINRPPE